MELMTRCDRCGALVETASERFSNGTVYYAPCAVMAKISSNGGVVMDGRRHAVLCTDCMGELSEWLDGKGAVATEPDPARLGDVSAAVGRGERGR